MLSVKVNSVKEVGEEVAYHSYSLRFSKGSGLHEYSSAYRLVDKAKRVAEFEEAVDILYGNKEPDPLLVASLLGKFEDGSSQVLGVLYLSIPQLMKKVVRK